MRPLGNIRSLHLALWFSLTATPEVVSGEKRITTLLPCISKQPVHIQNLRFPVEQSPGDEGTDDTPSLEASHASHVHVFNGQREECIRR